MPLASDLSALQETHPALRQKLGTASTLEDLIGGFRDQLSELEIVIQDEFSRDVLLPVGDGEFLIVSAG